MKPRYRNVTFDEAVFAINTLGGKEQIQVLMAKTLPGSIERVKHGSEIIGRYEAFRNKLGDKISTMLLADQVELVIESPIKLTVRQKELPVVDSNGRFIFHGLEKFATNADWAYCLDRDLQPSYAEVLDAFEYAFQRKGFFSAARFEDMAEAKKQAMLAGPYANLFKGIYARPFAIALPSVNILDGHLGDALAEIYVPAAERGYHRSFSERAFNDYLGDTLAGQVKRFSHSRQDQLIAALREGPQVLWVFMNSLQGGSINGDRKLIANLPHEFMLGGTIVNATVIAGYPDIVAKDASTLLYYNAADVWRSSRSLCFGPADERLDFRNWDGLGSRDESNSGSVAVRV